MRVPPSLRVMLAAALLGACAGPRISTEEQAALEAPARALEAQGAWREAAAAWQQAATTRGDGPLATVFRLNAADALLVAGDGAAAARLAGELPESLEPRLATRRALVLADADLVSADPGAALARLGPEIDAEDPGSLARFRRIRADALEATGDPLGAARERALREPLLAATTEQYRNRQRIWELLAQVPTEALLAQTAQPPEPFSGWVELADIARRHVLDADALELAIAEWTARYPGHPAGEQLVPQLVERVRLEATPPSLVALLLPQSGPFAGAAAAVRDGFMAAWLADAPNPQRPELIVRDSASGDVPLTYSAALAEGADFVVGPLTRDGVDAVLGGADLAVPTLLLNYPSAASESAPMLAASANPDSPSGAVVLADTAGAPGLPQDAGPVQRDLARVFYFALSPEDEAMRVAEFAHGRGYRQAGVLALQGSWGERVSDAFARRWNALGGVVAATQAFPDHGTGLSDAVEQLLNIDDSKQRARDLRATLRREFEHDPQPRSDLDVIFIAAFPQSARQLKPLLLFHRAEEVAVVATSHVYAGVPDPQLDQDIEGVVFGDMPWLLAPQQHALPEQVARAWPSAAGAGGRLYAFGADAYSLIARIRELRTSPGATYPGLTGHLSVAPGHRIRRELQWAQIRDGAPVAVDAGTVPR